MFKQMAQQSIDRLWSEVQHTQQQIGEQQKKIEKAIEDEKPQKFIDSYTEEKARLVAYEKDLRQAWERMALQTQLITPASEALAGAQMMTGAMTGSQDASKDDTESEESDYYKVLQSGMPPPSSFAKVWPAFQYPVPSLDDEASFEPLFNIHRPHTAQGLPASYALRAAGKFLDRMQYAKIDTVTSEALMAFVRVLSASYMNLNTKEAHKILQPYLGTDHIGQGPEPKGEAEMMEQFRAVMLNFLQKKMTKTNRFSSLEPSMASEGNFQTDGTGRLRGRYGMLSGVSAMILEGRDEFGGGGGGSPIMQLGAYYGKMLVRSRNDSVVLETFYPVLALEVIGHGFRVHILYFTDRVSCEPLTPWLHFADLRVAQPQYMEYLMGVLQAVAECADDLCDEVNMHLQPKKPGPKPKHIRAEQLQDGIPYMLQNPGNNITRLVENKHVYLSMPKDSSSELEPFVAKVQSTPYPWDLHDELAALGLAPKLLDGERLFPGGVEVIRMAYLDPDDGWEPLGRFSGEWRGLEELCNDALVQLHACLGGRAVHGDLNPYNVYIRSGKPDVDADQSASALRPVAEQIMFVDLSWGGKTGEVTYPAFVNTILKSAISDPAGPAGKLIEQKHDLAYLKRSLERCSPLPMRRPSAHASSTSSHSRRAGLPQRRCFSRPFSARGRFSQATNYKLM
ncbi:hypothetical protein COCSUDRAFT_61877 [Coccomyxa subellipsoidea C-169]|uniref:Protein kinase domain-containing protein n=1 Tax=Coccomyxa subellipsoidea (strain C-169) TaxID=574566 RepID=I0Z1D3_COCSC|nr:hypothetical protein COCSUDRAFT_61877 [Coccomyxa subellipsoidea C-169]EIE24452.1 hypothetical protein COCSUDRAFT_61877 [Coccomyxa subellipsoidea C-169]|eukprot:XP_005648996.1 hypothetical protein COCSUDRAFT_61877 [Coccomyxa subellipsoidea C-169]